jgi:hypothetical protein
MSEKKVRLIAFYLPQYHPIPENDKWWGKGFTEWTNVTKARPLFRGHYQPHFPADLGYYDLRVPETRTAQAEMAREHGIEGFCYWYYWFAGKRLLERPFCEVLESGKPDFPFCLAWANQSWSGVWHGAPDRILIEQTYPGVKDYESHFYAVLDAFSDSRYITIEGKPVFVVFRPHELPDPKRFIDCWRELAIKSGLKGLYFIGYAEPLWIPTDCSFDASVLNNLGITLSKLHRSSRSYLDRICRKLINKDLRQLYRELSSKPTVYLYKDAIKHALPPLEKDFDQYPCVIPNWDNTPRSGVRSVVLHNSTPELFRIHLKEAIAQVYDRTHDKRVVFVKSWNEWAEGNYLEPDQRFGKAYLEVVKEEISCHLVEITPAKLGKS